MQITLFPLESSVEYLQIQLYAHINRVCGRKQGKLIQTGTKEAVQVALMAYAIQLRSELLDEGEKEDENFFRVCDMIVDLLRVEQILENGTYTMCEVKRILNSIISV